MLDISDLYHINYNIELIYYSNYATKMTKNIKIRLKNNEEHYTEQGLM